MRAVALHKDVVVAISEVWQTTCTAVRAGDEAVLIDSPIYPEELRALPQMLAQSGFRVRGLLTTHGDWDHLLATSAFPGTTLGCAESTAARLAQSPDEPARELAEFDAEHYVQRDAPLELGELQALPVPGRIQLGSGAQARELELHPTGGHTSDGVAYWLEWARVLVCGDHLSPVEIPALSPSGGVHAYLQTLERLRPLVARCEWVVPGHGAPIGRERALAVLEEDAAYLGALRDLGESAPLPASRDDHVQRRAHAANVAFLSAR
ncbi:MAG TPA: MBL fold metallo-hydrolase [Solirubrobacteraceae bacterium]|nr:MBL fold metallo-hydrolase [Solirubrobacteraceae bacterium]